jgi:hypothetical protein
MSTVDLSQLSTEELEAALANKKTAERKEREEKKKEYEEGRDEIVLEFVERAVDLGKQLNAFKEECHTEMDMQQEKLNEYGGIRGNSKGGFSITHSSGDLRVVRRRATEPVWDERSTKAVSLIQDFLGDTVKKKDKDVYEVLISFISRNEKGELEYAKVMNLLQHENRWNDPRWIEGLKLIRESYSIHLKGYSYEFYVKSDLGKWLKIELNFSSL